MYLWWRRCGEKILRLCGKSIFGFGINCRQSWLRIGFVSVKTTAHRVVVKTLLDDKHLYLGLMDGLEVECWKIGSWKILNLSFCLKTF